MSIAASEDDDETGEAGLMAPATPAGGEEDEDGSWSMMRCRRGDAWSNCVGSNVGLSEAMSAYARPRAASSDAMRCVFAPHVSARQCCGTESSWVAPSYVMSTKLSASVALKRTDDSADAAPIRQKSVRQALMVQKWQALARP